MRWPLGPSWFGRSWLGAQVIERVGYATEVHKAERKGRVTRAVLKS